MIRWKSWYRWTTICLLTYLYLAVAVALQRQQEASSDPDTGLIPVTVRELVRLLRDPAAPARPAPPAALVGLATPPPAPRPPSPPALERLRRDNTMITTNYSCRISTTAAFRDTWPVFAGSGWFWRCTGGVGASGTRPMRRSGWGWR